MMENGREDIQADLNAHCFVYKLAWSTWMGPAELTSPPIDALSSTRPGATVISLLHFENVLYLDHRLDCARCRRLRGVGAHAGQAVYQLWRRYDIPSMYSRVNRNIGLLI